MMIFRWDKATDLDGDPITYTLSFYEDINGDKSVQPIKVYERISQPFFYMNALRERRDNGQPLFVTGGYYLWEVEAVDNKGRASGSTHTQKFHVIFTNAGMGIITGIVLSNTDYTNIINSTVTLSIGTAAPTVVPVSEGAFAMAVDPGRSASWECQADIRMQSFPTLLFPQDRS